MSNTRKIVWAASVALLAWSLTWRPAMGAKKYDPGASDTEIKIGQTMPYSGPASSYATIGRVEAAYFQKINDEGGVNGRKLKLISVDDGYSPARTVEMTRKLVEQDEVLLTFQQLGTAPNAAIQKYLNGKKVPQLFVASGADVFFNIATPKFAAQAIRKAYDTGWKPLQYLNAVSASVGAVLAPAGLDKSAGIISSTYLKDPSDKQWADDPGIKEWIAFMKKYYPDGALDDQSNAFAYTVAQAMAHVLKQCGNDLSRANIMKQAASMKNVEFPLLLPGIKVNTSADDHAPIEQEQLAKFDGERWVLFGELYDVQKK